MYGKNRDGNGKAVLTDPDGILLQPSGKYADAAAEGRLFSVANQAAVATVAQDTAISTGLGVANPTGSGKLLVMLEFGWALSVVGPDEGMLGLQTATDGGFAAALDIRCTRFGAGTSIAYADDGVTLVGQAFERVVTTYGTGAITTWQGAGPQVYEINGGIVIAPGRSIYIATTTITTAAFQFSFLWEEIDA
jgi:hypothetical protein